MTKWIKCSDRLPSKNESVGYVFDGKSIRSDVYYSGFNGSWEKKNSLGFYEDVKGITHWTPYPEIPND
jgi:hypothetical protein